MKGIFSNEEEIVKGILMAHFQLLLRILFSGCEAQDNSVKILERKKKATGLRTVL